MEEHPASGAAGINRLAQRDEIGLVLVEEVRELLQLAAVAGQAGELGEQEAGDVAALHVLHHALGLGVLHDGLAALPGEVIHFLDLPPTAFGIAAGAFFVVFGAVALGLILGADANPDTDRFQKTIVLDSTISYQKSPPQGKKKV